MKGCGLRTVSGAIVVCALLVLCSQAWGGLRVSQLRCEYLENPLGIDVSRPRLSWILESDERGVRQEAFQVIVAGTVTGLSSGKGVLWNSGRLESDETLDVRYDGRALQSEERVFWKVIVWDQDGRKAESKAACWEMGLLQPGDWKARWISRTTDTQVQPAPLLRREFAVSGRVKSARAYICGLGYYELYMNGRRVGDHLLDPGYTRYDRRALYVTYDITENLQHGANAVGVILGTGWYNCHTEAVWDFHKAPWRAAPKLLLQIRIDYADGRSELVVSDESWRTSTGPIVFDSIYGGESYDARLEKKNWARAGYDASGWEAVQLVEPPGGKLVAQMMPPIKVGATIRPVSVTEPRPGTYIVDVGQNLAGMAELRVRGPAGTQVQMRYGERLFPDGTLDTRDIEQHIKKRGAAQPFQTDKYILKGGKSEEVYASRFTYHGFQYIEVTGFPGKPTTDSFRIRFIHSAVPKAGEFSCSNEMLNRIQRAAEWAFLSNFQGIPTDCPHREKNGWTGDAHLACEQAQLNFFPVSVHQKWMNDLADEQKPSGQLPGIVPTSGWGYTWGNGPAWDSAFLLIPYYQYVYYGDVENFRRNYEGMRRYVDYLTGRAQNGIVSIGLNDWAPWKTQTQAGITDTAYYYVDARIVSLAAGLLGKKDDEEKYSRLAEQIKGDFNSKFFDPNTGLYDNGSQTALSCALCQGLAPDGQRDRVMSNLVAAVEKADGHMDAGILGTKYLLNALLENGRTDLAYRMVNQKDQPGWGWWLEQGATTLWEQWSGNESRNHIMFGDVSAWFYKALAGIQPDARSPGFKHFFISPNVVGDLTFARGAYKSIRGEIVSDWHINDGLFHLRVKVPANSTATVSLPVGGELREGRRPASKAPGVEIIGERSGRLLLRIGSGSYRFSGPLSQKPS